MVVVADGSELAERKLRRVFWTDPALGVARYADAGYPEAQARRSGTACELSSRAKARRRELASSFAARRARATGEPRSSCAPAGSGTAAAPTSTDGIMELPQYYLPQAEREILAARAARSRRSSHPGPLSSWARLVREDAAPPRRARRTRSATWPIDVSE
jgi:hypothetical protein